MCEPREDAAARLWWGLRRYAGLVVLVVAGAVALSVAKGSAVADGAPQFRATSLVVASELQLRPEQLPRFASTVFRAGTVARETVARTRVAVPPDELIPAHVTVEPVEGTILVAVTGINRDPGVAAELANTAAAVLTEQLNAPGPGVGEFAIQERATAPSSPEPTASPALPVVVGALAGLALALGSVGLLLLLRRPVLSGAEAAGSVGAPLLGALALPRGEASPRDVPGVSALRARLWPTCRERVVLVSLRRYGSRRARLARLLARALARSGPVYYVAVEGGDTALDRAPPEEGRRLARITLEELKDAPARTPALIDGPSTDALDVPQFLPGDATAVLVAGEGVRRAALAAAARQFLPGELVGVVFLHGRRWRPTRRRRRGSAAGTGTGSRERAEPASASPRARSADGAGQRAGGGDDPAPAQRQVGSGSLDA